MWLTATNLGICIHPMAAIPYLAQRISAEETESLSVEHIRLINEAHSEISDAFELKQKEIIAMLFRAGYDGEPPARSLKLPPIIFSVNQ